MIFILKQTSVNQYSS